MVSSPGMPYYEIAPYSQAWGLVADIVSCGLLGISIICCSLVLFGILHLENKNKLRGRILVGLFSSHVWAGAVFLSFIVASLSGSPPRSGTMACRASAFLVESAIWGEYLFTIAVAVVSYCILLHPLSSLTLSLEKYWFLVDIGVCISALGMAGLHTGLYPAVYIGGFCWNGSQRNVFNELINCLPRVIVFLVIVTLYWRIHSYLLHQRFSFKSTKPSFPPWLRPSTFGNHPQRQHHAIHSTPEGDHGSSGVLQRAPHHEDVERDTSSSGTPWEAIQSSSLAESLMLDVEHESLLQLELDMLEQRTTNPPRSFLSEGSSQTTIRPDTVASSLPPCLDTIVVGDKTRGDDVEANAVAIEDRTLGTGDRASMNTPSQDFSVCDSRFPPRTGGHDLNPYDAGPDYSKRYRNHPKSMHLGENIHHRYHTIHQLMTHRAALLFLLFPLTYLVLTVVSLTRLIVDYSSDNHVVSVRALSRWTLFLQGPLDALTYGFIAFKIKKEVGEEIKTRYRRFCGEKSINA